MCIKFIATRGIALLLILAPLHAEDLPRREGLTQTIREHLLHRDDAAISALTANWRGDARSPQLALCEDGLPRLMALSTAIADCGVVVDKEYEMASAVLEQWMEHEPQNTLPMIQRALQLAERAPRIADLKERGKLLQTMVRHLEAAEQLSGRTADWYLGYLGVATTLLKQEAKDLRISTKLPKDRVKEIFEEGIRKYPDYAVLYFMAARLNDEPDTSFSEHLGIPSNLNEFAKYVCELLPVRGLEPYTRLWWSVADYGQEFFKPGRCDWEKFRSGFETMMKRTPGSKRNLAYFLKFARIAHDKVTARKLLEQVGGHPDAEVFAVEARFLEVEAWAKDAEPYGQMRWSIPGKSANGVAWSPDGTTIYMGEWGDGITLVDAATGKTKGSFSTGEKGRLLATDIAVSSDGSLIAAGFGFRRGDNPCCIWDREGKVVKLFHTKSGPFECVKFNSHNELLAAGGSENDPAEVWQWSSGQEPERLIIFDRHRHPISCVAWLPDHGRLANCNAGRLSFWNGAKESTWRQTTVPEDYARAHDISVSPDQRWTAVALGGNLNGINQNKPIGGVAIFDARRGTVREGIPSPLVGTLRTLAYSPDRHFIAAGGVDGFLYFLNADTLEISHWWNMEVGSIKRLSWSPDGNRMAVTTSNPHKLWLWELK